MTSARPARYLAQGGKKQKEPQRGKVRRRDSVMRSLRERLREAGLPSDVRFHDFRHTAGTHALRRGRPIHEVSKMFGHCLDSLRKPVGRGPRYGDHQPGVLGRRLRGPPFTG
jgi:integrase